MREEIDIFDDGKVTVSNDQFIAGNKAYSLNQVLAVNVAEVKYKRGLGLSMSIVLLGFVVLVTMYSERKGALLGGLFITAGAIFSYGIINTRQYTIVLTSALGDTETLVNADKTYLDKVAQAISKTIAYRAA